MSEWPLRKHFKFREFIWIIYRIDDDSETKVKVRHGLLAKRRTHSQPCIKCVLRLCHSWLRVVGYSVSISINALSVIITFFRCIYFSFFTTLHFTLRLLSSSSSHRLFLFKYHMEFSFSGHVHTSLTFILFIFVSVLFCVLLLVLLLFLRFFCS